jgi:hypothetical protein
MNNDLQKLGMPVDAVCDEIDIRIDGKGQWHHEGSAIERIEIVRLFANILKKDANGDYWLETPVEKMRIQVEDVPFIAIAMNAKGRGKKQSLSFEPNVGDNFKAGTDNPIRVETNAETQEPFPYVTVRNNLEAKITRSVFYDMVDLAIEYDGAFGIWSDGVFFPLGNLESAD